MGCLWFSKPPSSAHTLQDLLRFGNSTREYVLMKEK